jgi:hypothetical protein
VHGITLALVPMMSGSNSIGKSPSNIQKDSIDGTCYSGHPVLPGAAYTTQTTLDIK